jgi:hypothetical protein
MVATLVIWLVYAVFLKVAIGVATDVAGHRNTIGRAFVTAAMLSLSLTAALGFGPLALMLWPILWLLVVKSMYDIGWFRAILVWCMLVVLAVGLVFFVLIPLGLISAVTLGALT